MIVLSVGGVSFSFGADSLLEGISFSLSSGDRLGVVGPNGCGKTTLLKIIAGQAEPDSGSVFRAKDTTLGMLGQNEAFDLSPSGNASETVLERASRAAFPELVKAERRLEVLAKELEGGERTQGGGFAAAAAEYSSLSDEFSRAGGHTYMAVCRSVLDRMGFSGMLGEAVSSLSGGQKTRLALASELCREPDILMLDEPTNHLDAETVGWLENYLSGYRKCLIAVSHDRYFLDRVTNRTLFISNRHAKIYDGGYTASAGKRAADREIYERQYNNQQKEIARQEAIIEQQRRWNRERNIIAAESRQKMLDRMVKLAPPEREKNAKPGMRFISAMKSGEELFTVKDLSFAYPGSDRLFDSLNFTLRRGERVFAVGPNGCGKSTLLKLICGKLMPTSGRVDAGYNVTPGYYDQENQNLDPDGTVLSELERAYPGMTEREVRTALGRFLFTGDDVKKPIDVLSGGERARLTLAKLMLSSVNTLVLDEPTNHLDISAREALEEAVASYDGSVICVSHDRAFINRLADRIIGFTSGGIYSLPLGSAGRGWEEWVACTGDGMRFAVRIGSVPHAEKAGKGGRGGTAPAASDGGAGADGGADGEKPLTGKDEYLRRKREQAEERRAAARTERLKKEAAELEKSVDRMNAELFGEAAVDYVRAAELTSRIEEAENRLLEIYCELG